MLWERKVKYKGFWQDIDHCIIINDHENVIFLSVVG